MKNPDFARKIKELRTRKGISQEELAGMCGLSLRTVQRVELGETEPRGDTARRLSIALKTSPDELMDWVEQEDRSMLAVLNLSALSFTVFPLLGIIVPLVLWILKRGKIKHLDDTGKNLLNFQISWSIFLFLLYLLIVGSLLGDRYRVFGSLGSPKFILISVGGMYLFNIVLIVLNTARSLKSKKVWYQPAVPFLR